MNLGYVKNGFHVFIHLLLLNVCLFCRITTCWGSLQWSCPSLCSVVHVRFTNWTKFTGYGLQQLKPTTNSFFDLFLLGDVMSGPRVNCCFVLVHMFYCVSLCFLTDAISYHSFRWCGKGLVINGAQRPIYLCVDPTATPTPMTVFFGILWGREHFLISRAINISSS